MNREGLGAGGDQGHLGGDQGQLGGSPGGEPGHLGGSPGGEPGQLGVGGDPGHLYQMFQVIFSNYLHVLKVLFWHS